MTFRISLFKTIFIRLLHLHTYFLSLRKEGRRNFSLKKYIFDFPGIIPSQVEGNNRTVRLLRTLEINYLGSSFGFNKSIFIIRYCEYQHACLYYIWSKLCSQSRGQYVAIQQQTLENIGYIIVHYF